MRQLKVLELFSGTRSIGKAFERKGHEVYSIDWDQRHQASWYTDIEKVRPQDILKRFGRPDVIWASPDCTTFSVAAISHHRELDKVLGGGASKDPIRAEVRPHGPERDKAHSRAQADGVVHREPARHDEEDAVDAMGSATHGHILPVRRHTNASNRHLVQRAGPRIQAAVQERRPMPREGASRC